MIFSSFTNEELVKLAVTTNKVSGDGNSLTFELAKRLDKQIHVHQCNEVRLEKISSIALSGPDDE